MLNSNATTPATRVTLFGSTVPANCTSNLVGDDLGFIRTTTDLAALSSDIQMQAALGYTASFFCERVAALQEQVEITGAYGCKDLLETLNNLRTGATLTAARYLREQECNQSFSLLLNGVLPTAAIKELSWLLSSAEGIARTTKLAVKVIAAQVVLCAYKDLSPLSIEMELVQLIALFAYWVAGECPRLEVYDAMQQLQLAVDAQIAGALIVLA